jgi:hypothetical protein
VDELRRVAACPPACETPMFAVTDIAILAGLFAFLVMLLRLQ